MADTETVDSAVSTAIVGGGGSGTLMAFALAQRGALSQDRTVVIGANHRRFRGIAYDVFDDNLLLNAPAGNMSALSAQPDHFVEYCQSIDPALNAGSFVPRRLYGDYLESTFASLCPFPSFDWLDDEVLQVTQGLAGAGFRLQTRSGRRLHADRVILALGHQPPRVPKVLQSLKGAPNFVANPYDLPALDRLPNGLPVLILGTGHTAIDVLFRLMSAGPRQILMLSRHGWFPEGHRKNPRPPKRPAPPDYFGDGPLTSLYCLRAIREQIQRQTLEGENWRDVLNALRPYLPAVWSRLSESERSRFLRHGLAIWDVHRHRLAPMAAHRLRQLVESGWVDIRAGQLMSGRRLGTGFEITVQARGSTGRPSSFEVGALVNCTGPGYGIGPDTPGVLASLAQDGWACSDPLKLGLLIDDHYQLIGRDGKSIPNLHYLGPLLKGRYWEAIAIPELRQHASQLAALLLPPKISV